MPTGDDPRAAFFIDANRNGEPTVIASPSGRHRLAIQRYDTPPTRWGYTRGIVTRVADGALVCDVKRNLGGFHHTFVIKDGHEYLITGRTYTSQTIIDLDAGREYAPSVPDSGHGFCWTKCYLSPDGNTLAVDGCVWACPYEIRFYDFRDPARGWPELTAIGAAADGAPSDRRPPRWLDDVTCECHYADDEDDADAGPQERTRVQRRADSMVLIDHWVSPAEQHRRAERRRLDDELDAWWDTFRSTDPLYLSLVEQLGRHDLPRADLLRADRRLSQYFRRVSPRASADLRWDIDAATITLQLYDPAGNRAAAPSFPATPDGIAAAVAALAAAFAP